MSSRIKARMNDDKTSTITMRIESEIECLFMIDGIINKFSEATGIPVSKILNDLKSWNEKRRNEQ